MSDLVEAAASGDRLTALRALRDVLAAELAAGGSKREMAAMAAQFMDALRQIEELAPAPPKKGTVLDEVGDRRRARGATASGVSGADRPRARGRR